MSESISPAQQQSIADFCQSAAFFRPDAALKIEQYWHILSSWQKKNNLTGFTDVDTWLTKGVFDAYGLMSELQRGDQVLDVGSGSGLPGMVVACCMNDVSVVAVERRHKRAAFLRAAAHACDCDVRVIQGDVSQVKEQFSVITARALAPPDVLIEMTKHCAQAKTRWICPQTPCDIDTAGTWCQWAHKGHQYHWWVSAPDTYHSKHG